MTAATTLITIGLIFLACALVCWLDEQNDRRQRRRRLERLKERRAHLDSVEPRRWERAAR